ncbi:MAG: toll/interleukin-1 receptor domain-containing protein [Promethearchaeota archaeon]
MGLIVFISYADKDEQFFKIPEIAKGLESKDCPEIDKVLYWKRDAYRSLVKYMNENIGRCDLMLLFCSSNSEDSKNVELEWTTAVDLKKEIIPVFLGDRKCVPNILRQNRGLPFDPSVPVQDIIQQIYELILSVVQDLGEVRDTAVPLYEHSSKIRGIVHDIEKISIKVIAATGLNTLGTVLPTIILSAPKHAKIKISMGILDTNTLYKEYIPPHWDSESKITLERVKKEFKDGPVSIDLFKFKILPALHGLLINDKHLFLGFFGWIKSGGKPQLCGAQLPHSYYHPDHPDFPHYYDLFEQWFRHCPQE